MTGPNTVPIGAFPTQFGQQAQPSPWGMAPAQGLADVLASMQQQRENQFRMQELQNQMMQQQALQRYYEEQARIGHDQESRLAGENLLAQQKHAAAGRAVKQYLGQPGVFTPGAMGGGGMASSSTMPPFQGNTFREMTQGAMQAMGGPAGVQAALTGVPDEHAVDAVKAIQEAQATLPQAPAPPELPTSAKEFQFMQGLSQIDPSGQAAQFFYENWVKKQPGVVVNNNMGKAETAFGVKTGENTADRNAELFKDANNAAASVPSMTEAHKLVDKAFTGFGANQQLGVSRVLSKMGVKVSKQQAGDTQTMLKLLRDQTLTYLQTRALGSGTAVSDKDREFMERQSAADITMEPMAIKRIIRINMGLALERMVSTKMELQQSQLDYPATAPQLQGRINLIDKKLAPIWAEYWKMMSEEQKAENSASNVVNQLFPARR